MLTKKLPHNLSLIYENSKRRSAFSEKIREKLDVMHKKKYCEDDILKNIELDELIGLGDWGNIYSAYFKNSNPDRKIALKMTKINNNDLDNPYTKESISWYEYWMLDMFRNLIVERICPNLPLCFGTFLCSEHNFIFRKTRGYYPCIVTAQELASGDLRKYLKYSLDIPDAHIYVILFQIMAALHTIQINGQILNNDVKASNILFYDIKPGGYWHYKICNVDFYVPNFGKIIILNDFGVSTLYDPYFQLFPNKKKQTFDLGSRLAININGIFSPIKVRHIKSQTVRWVGKKGDYFVSSGIKYKVDKKSNKPIITNTKLSQYQKLFLFSKGITTNPKKLDFFKNSWVIPPFEFYNDVQDALRIFAGGKRTTQNGFHKSYPCVSTYVKQRISRYMGKAENTKALLFSVSAYHVLAGEFILKFFSRFWKKPKNSFEIEYYRCEKYENKF